MLNNILEYQKKDAQLVAIEKEIADSPAKKVVNQMVEYVKTAQQKLVAIEKNASSLIVEFEELKNQFNNSIKTVDDLTKQKLEILKDDELKENVNLVTQENARILNIEKNISTLSAKINTTLIEFEKTKEQGKLAKKKYEQGMQAYNEFVQSKQNLIHKLKRELAELEKNVDGKLLAKYKELRSDKKFPIFVPLMGHSCGGCSMELPIAKFDKLKTTGILECENCHRIIYLKDDEK